MAHTELNLRERRTIGDMLNTKISVREIAAEIGRHVSTVYHEIKRNQSYCQIWCPSGFHAAALSWFEGLMPLMKSTP